MKTGTRHHQGYTCLGPHLAVGVGLSWHNSKNGPGISKEVGLKDSPSPTCQC